VGECATSFDFWLSVTDQYSTVDRFGRDLLVYVHWQLSTLPIMNADANQADMSEDQVYTSRQSARHVCVAFRRYFEAHLAIRSDQIRRSHMHSQAGSPLVETPAYKVDVFHYSSAPSNRRAQGHYVFELSISLYVCLRSVLAYICLCPGGGILWLACWWLLVISEPFVWSTY